MSTTQVSALPNVTGEGTEGSAGFSTGIVSPEQILAEVARSSPFTVDRATAREALLRTGPFCGTDTGYFDHRKIRTVPCRACMDAHAATERRRRAERANGLRPRTPGRRLPPARRTIALCEDAT